MEDCLDGGIDLERYWEIGFLTYFVEVWDRRLELSIFVECVFLRDCDFVVFKFFGDLDRRNLSFLLMIEWIFVEWVLWMFEDLDWFVVDFGVGDLLFFVLFIGLSFLDI